MSEPNGTSARLVEIGDLDNLTRHVDRLCDHEAWAALVDLRDRCRRALERPPPMVAGSLVGSVGRGGGGGGPASDPASVRTLCDLGAVWATESNGRAEAVAVHGRAVNAVAALGAPEPGSARSLRGERWR